MERPFFLRRRRQVRGVMGARTISQQTIFLSLILFCPLFLFTQTDGRVWGKEIPPHYRDGLRSWEWSAGLSSSGTLSYHTLILGRLGESELELRVRFHVPPFLSTSSQTGICFLFSVPFIPICFHLL